MAQERKETLQAASNEESTEQTLPPRPKVSRCTNISVLFLILSAVIFFSLFIMKVYLVLSLPLYFCGLPVFLVS